MPFIPRAESLRRLRQNVADKKPIIGCGAGTGISAVFVGRGHVVRAGSLPAAEWYTSLPQLRQPAGCANGKP